MKGVILSVMSIEIRIRNILIYDEEDGSERKFFFL